MGIKIEWEFVVKDSSGKNLNLELNQKEFKLLETVSRKKKNSIYDLIQAVAMKAGE